jgi:hypothetical protein
VAREVSFDGQRKMYLHTGWEKFSRIHNMEVGCLVNFLYEGDDEMSVKVFNDESCCMHYHDDEYGDDSDDISEEGEGQQNH